MVVVENRGMVVGDGVLRAVVDDDGPPGESVRV